jgi:hypothetical protein
MQDAPELILPPEFPDATHIDFASFHGKYAGRTCYLIGRGPTAFDYHSLTDVSDPIFFINDAVSLETHACSETFFFAHDAQLLVWLNGKSRSTAVLPIDGKIFRQTPGITLHHTGGLVFYHWREQSKEDLLTMTRDQIADLKQLYTHTGTIHSALHFIWFCGFKRVRFVGCDAGGGYDPRIANLSGSTARSEYTTIGQAQKILTQLFGLEAEYLGRNEER